MLPALGAFMTEIAEDTALQESSAVPAPVVAAAASTTTMGVLWALSLSHLLNDTVQALSPALYPVLKLAYGLSFTDVGMITFVFQMAGSLLQPVVGTFTDRRPMPYSLPVGMGVTLVGLLMLAMAGSFGQILFAA